jgi:thiamine-phosphate pyrophosphorylase
VSARHAPLVTYITDTAQVPEAEMLARVARLDALPPDLRKRFAVQLRDPELDGAELLRFGALLRTATEALGVRFFVNDRLDLALALEADGIHLGRKSVEIEDARSLLGDRVLVSIACHSEDDVVQAGDRGADMCTLSPIFETPGKGPPLGTAALERARKRLDEKGHPTAVIALGGIGEENFASCLRAGAAGVAMIRGEVSPGDIVRELRA